MTAVIDRLAIAGYRSIRSMILTLGTLNVVTGANGSGKSNLYRALKLLADAADGRLVSSLAREGGFDSVRWAGPEIISNEMIRGEAPVQGGGRKKPVSLRMGIKAEPFSYSFELGLPIPRQSMFDGDPVVKRECMWSGSSMEAKDLCVDRRGGTLRCRGSKGKWQDVAMSIASHASMLSEYADPSSAP